MALGVLIEDKHRNGVVRGPLPWLLLALALSSTSCVPAVTAGPVPARAETVIPVTAAAPLAASAPASSPDAAPATLGLFGLQAVALNAALPISAGPNPPATSYAFRARTTLDQLRSLDCLAQAIYYEARSESEDGQRAVAQVVLNRVRHPAWPNSVCGVVYQGPMRPGGGCQFTFTCDGSLAVRPAGLGWARARLLAAEALAGRAYAPVGLSTHYHTSAVFPAWAPRLVKTGIIGAHNFYRLPGGAGTPVAFNAAYAGSEPFPRPSMTLIRRSPVAVDLAALFAPPRSEAEIRAAVAPPSDIPQDPRWVASNLPESTVREEYRRSGQWRADAPTSISGN